MVARFIPRNVVTCEGCRLLLVLFIWSPKVWTWTTSYSSTLVFWGCTDQPIFQKVKYTDALLSQWWLNRVHAPGVDAVQDPVETPKVQYRMQTSVPCGTSRMACFCRRVASSVHRTSPLRGTSTDASRTATGTSVSSCKPPKDPQMPIHLLAANLLCCLYIYPNHYWDGPVPSNAQLWDKRNAQCHHWIAAFSTVTVLQPCNVVLSVFKCCVI